MVRGCGKGDRTVPNFQMLLFLLFVSLCVIVVDNYCDDDSSEALLVELELEMELGLILVVAVVSLSFYVCLHVCCRVVVEYGNEAVSEPSFC